MQRSRSRSGQVIKGHLLNGVGATHILWVILRIESNGGTYLVSGPLKVTLRSRAGQGQVKSGQIFKLVVWSKIGVYSIQLFSASSMIPFSSLQMSKTSKKNVIENFGMRSF